MCLHSFEACGGGGGGGGHVARSQGHLYQGHLHLKGESASCYRDGATQKSCARAGGNVQLRAAKAQQMPTAFILSIKAEAHHASVP